MADKVIYAMYDDDDTLMNGAKHLVKEGVKVSDVYSPMPLQVLIQLLELNQQD